MAVDTVGHWMTIQMLQSVAAGDSARHAPVWRRQSVSPVARGCEPGQVRKEAAVASKSGAGVGQAGAVSSVPGQGLAVLSRFNRINIASRLL